MSAARDSRSAALTTASQPLTARQVRMYRGGFLIFLVSESFFFVTLFAIRFLLAGLDRPPDQGVALATLATVGLLTTSVTAGLALRDAQAGNQAGLVNNVGVSFVLGLVVLAVIVFESMSAVPVGTRFGDIFQVTTWIHLAHIVFALVFFAAIWSSARRGRFSPENHWVVEAGVRFWWFVTATWLGLYVVFYWL